jgi:hypothetical protein
MTRLFLKMEIDIKIKYDDSFTALLKIIHIDKQQMAILFLKIKADTEIRYVDGFTTLLKIVYMDK